MAQHYNRYDNLITLLVVLTMMAMLGLTGRMVEHYGSALIAQVSKPPVQGYQRPQLPQQHTPPQQAQALGPQEPIKGLTEEENALIMKRFEQASALLHAHKYEYAITALLEVLAMVPNMPEGYVNLGFAYFGLEDYDMAEKSFTKAIELRPEQANAYYGLASVWDAKKDYEAALGAMRSFIHLAPANEPYVVKARSAIWEWEGLLGRIPGVGAAPQGSTPQIKIHNRGHTPLDQASAGADPATPPAALPDSTPAPAAQ